MFVVVKLKEMIGESIFFKLQKFFKLNTGIELKYKLV